MDANLRNLPSLRSRSISLQSASGTRDIITDRGCWTMSARYWKDKLKTLESWGKVKEESGVRPWLGKASYEATSVTMWDGEKEVLLI
jgi:hypothetical protein